MCQLIPVWPYVCELYQSESVEAACLKLQDQYDFNIPLLLFCCWTGRYYSQLSNKNLEDCKKFAEQWSQSVTAPMRRLRCDMKSSFMSEWPVTEMDWVQLRQQIKSAELHSEHLLLEGMARLCDDNQDGKGDFNCCLRYLSVCFDRRLLQSASSELANILIHGFSESMITPNTIHHGVS